MRRSRGAQVNAMWTELTFDKGILQAMTLEHSGGAVTDSLGQYRLCGVPTDSWLLVQVQHEDRLGSAFQLAIADAAGVHVRHLSFSREGARERAELDSALRDTTRILAPLAGTATLAGIVRGSGGRPIANAPGARRRRAHRPPAPMRTGGSASPGCRRDTGVEVRELGFPVQRQPVDLRRGRTVHRRSSSRACRRSRGCVPSGRGRGTSSSRPTAG